MSVCLSCITYLWAFTDRDCPWKDTQGKDPSDCFLGGGMGYRNRRELFFFVLFEIFTTFM